MTSLHIRILLFFGMSGCLFFLYFFSKTTNSRCYQTSCCGMTFGAGHVLSPLIFHLMTIHFALLLHLTLCFLVASIDILIPLHLDLFTSPSHSPTFFYFASPSHSPPFFFTSLLLRCSFAVYTVEGIVSWGQALLKGKREGSSQLSEHIPKAKNEKLAFYMRDVEL
ncbi:hypothetical protein M440DRAFT_1042174 [Trichoderma longibrachiatum ATCC 18648]|uniref:Uncharacterized protein n=1 Tax=Trichoderma longibrachiatum ATCC 18648 TaxID=983965 RepID=A0A2T4BY31_TRILO|nr:hypothetical protein M440DRAFT_1042174 [Trichoderma longibrachiatum ATCC 18648]